MSTPEFEALKEKLWNVKGVPEQDEAEVAQLRNGGFLNEQICP